MPGGFPLIQPLGVKSTTRVHNSFNRKQAMRTNTTPFLRRDFSKKLSNHFNDWFRNFQKNRVASVIPPENIEHYVHRRIWRTHIDSEIAKRPSHIEEHRVEFSIPHSRVKRIDFSLIGEYVQSVSEGMMRQLMESLYAKVGAAAEEVGNVVDGKDSPMTPALFLEGLEKISFGIDRWGNVSIPEFHLSEKALATLKTEADKLGEGFEKKVQEIIDRKTREALLVEEKRKARFKTKNLSAQK